MQLAPKIAIVHERLIDVGGSEKVIEQLATACPSAQVHVPIGESSCEIGALEGRVTVTGVDQLHRLIGRRSHAPLLPLFIASFSHMDFGDVDAVVISHHSMALSAVHATDKPTIAYVHSPARWAWDKSMRDGEASGLLGKAALSGLSAITRRTERKAAPLVTRIVANSREVQDRIARWWGRSSTVVHPPVDTDFYSVDVDTPREDFVLLAGRLVPYKRPELAIAAASAAGVPLVVAGVGRMLKQCMAVAGSRTTFLGHVSDKELLSLQRRARALLMPGVDDFGIVPVEAMSCGTPVIATAAGGALDTVVQGVSGHLIAPGSDAEVVERFASAMRSFDDAEFDVHQVHNHAQKFSRPRFRAEMCAIVDSVL